MIRLIRVPEEVREKTMLELLKKEQQKPEEKNHTWKVLLSKRRMDAILSGDSQTLYADAKMWSDVFPGDRMLFYPIERETDKETCSAVITCMTAYENPKKFQEENGEAEEVTEELSRSKGKILAEEKPLVVVSFRLEA